MLSELEMEVVKRSKVFYFAAHMQCIYFDYDDIMSELTANKLPAKENVDDFRNYIDKEAHHFDFIYSVMLPHEPVNPLQLEQKAWKLLSPKIKEHQNQYGSFLESYSSEPDSLDKKEMLGKYVETAFVLVKKWQVISNSYKVKYENAIYSPKKDHSEMIVAREQKVKDLIVELSGSPE